MFGARRNTFAIKMEHLLFTLILGLAPNQVLLASQAVDVQGHRGARSVLPENSLAAFKYALETGVDTLELDMGVSADGVVVVVHDQKINQTICRDRNGEKPKSNLWIHELSLSEIKGFDCGATSNPKFPNQQLIPGTRIPTLDEVFTLVNESKLESAKSVRFNIETKSRPDRPHAQPDPASFISAILEVIEKHGFQSRTTIQSFDHRTLVEAYKQAPELKRAALFRKKPKSWIDESQAVYADIVSPKWTLIDKQTVQAIQGQGMQVIPWTANTEPQWRLLLEMGVDGIITDDPEPLLRMLGRNLE